MNHRGSVVSYDPDIDAVGSAFHHPLVADLLGLILRPDLLDLRVVEIGGLVGWRLISALDALGVRDPSEAKHGDGADDSDRDLTHVFRSSRSSFGPDQIGSVIPQCTRESTPRTSAGRSARSGAARRPLRSSRHHLHLVE